MKPKSAGRFLGMIALLAFAATAAASGHAASVDGTFFLRRNTEVSLRSPGTTQHDQPQNNCAQYRSTSPGRNLVDANRR
jgi:hypothetical protein